MKYFVNEIQNDTSTTYVFDELSAAESKYYYILSFAAVSDVAVHGAVLYDNNGAWFCSKTYRHSTDEQV